MAVWKLSPQYKKSAVEKMFFYKDGKVISIEQGYRWATFTVESDERPLTNEELKNADGYELCSIDNDESWEMWDMMDGCWMDIEAVNDKTTEQDVAEFEAAWEEDSYEAVEALGWNQDDCEYYYYGPLELTNETTGEVFQGESDDTPVDVPVADEESSPEVTDWFPVSVNPIHEGSYQVITTSAKLWPFPSYALWNGKTFSEPDVEQWRGLAENPNV